MWWTATEPQRWRSGELLCAIAFLGLAEAVDAILFATRDSDATVRGVAAWALGRLRWRKAVGVLEHLLTDHQPVHDRLSYKKFEYRSGELVEHGFYLPWTGISMGYWSDKIDDARVSDIAKAALVRLRNPSNEEN